MACLHDRRTCVWSAQGSLHRVRATLITPSMLLYYCLVKLQFQGHNTAGLFSVRILLLLSIFACARSYGELIGIRHASCIFFFAFLSMAVSPSLFKEQALYILILLRRHFPCYDAQVLQLSNMILQWNTCIYL